MSWIEDRQKSPGAINFIRELLMQGRNIALDGAGVQPGVKFRHPSGVKKNVPRSPQHHIEHREPFHALVG